MSSEILLHVGYPKTATSTIQTVMGQFQDLTHIGKKFPFRKSGEYERDTFRRFCFNIYALNDSAFKTSSTSKIFEGEIAPLLTTSRKIFVSDEGFTNPLEGDNLRAAERLHSFFPQAKVLMVLRNQLEWLRSYYEMWPFDPLIPGIGTKRLSFDEWIDLSFKRFGYSSLPQLQYDITIQHYEKLFGPENVVILTYEQFKANPESLAVVLSELTGANFSRIQTSLLETRENQNTTRHVQNVYKQFFGDSTLNKRIPTFIKKYLYSSLSKMKQPVKLSSQNKSRLVEYFSDANIRLSEIRPEISLEGYPGINY